MLTRNAYFKLIGTDRVKLKLREIFKHTASNQKN